MRFAFGVEGGVRSNVYDGLFLPKREDCTTTCRQRPKPLHDAENELARRIELSSILNIRPIFLAGITMLIAVVVPFTRDPRVYPDGFFAVSVLVMVFFFVWIIWPIANALAVAKLEKLVVSRWALQFVGAVVLLGSAWYLSQLYFENSTNIPGNFLFVSMLMTWALVAHVLADSSEHKKFYFPKLAVYFWAQYFMPIGVFFLGPQFKRRLNQYKENSAN